MMNYRAARRLCVIPKGTETEIIYEPGDLVPDFTAWDEVVKRAHLGQGNVVMDMPQGMGQAVVAVMEERFDPPTPKKEGKHGSAKHQPG